MSEQAAQTHTLPQDIDQNAAPAPPPKQRFKQALAQTQPAVAGVKRPLPSPTPAGDSPEGSELGQPIDEDTVANGDGDTGEHAEKQPHIVPSIIRGIAPFRKPRVGSEFQADIPELRPRP